MKLLLFSTFLELCFGAQSIQQLIANLNVSSTSSQITSNLDQLYSKVLSTFPARGSISFKCSSCNQDHGSCYISGYCNCKTKEYAGIKCEYQYNILLLEVKEWLNDLRYILETKTLKYVDIVKLYGICKSFITISGLKSATIAYPFLQILKLTVKNPSSILLDFYDDLLQLSFIGLDQIEDDIGNYTSQEILQMNNNYTTVIQQLQVNQLKAFRKSNLYNHTTYFSFKEIDLLRLNDTSPKTFQARNFMFYFNYEYFKNITKLDEYIVQISYDIIDYKSDIYVTLDQFKLEIQDLKGNQLFTKTTKVDDLNTTQIVNFTVNDYFNGLNYYCLTYNNTAKEWTNVTMESLCDDVQCTCTTYHLSYFAIGTIPVETFGSLYSDNYNLGLTYVLAMVFSFSAIWAGLLAGHILMPPPQKPTTNDYQQVNKQQKIDVQPEDVELLPSAKNKVTPLSIVKIPDQGENDKKNEQNTQISPQKPSALKDQPESLSDQDLNGLTQNSPIKQSKQQPGMMERALKLVTADGEVITTEYTLKYQCDMIYNIFPYRGSWRPSCVRFCTLGMQFSNYAFLMSLTLVDRKGNQVYIGSDLISVISMAFYLIFIFFVSPILTYLQALLGYLLSLIIPQSFKYYAVNIYISCVFYGFVIYTGVAIQLNKSPGLDQFFRYCVAFGFFSQMLLLEIFFSGVGYLITPIRKLRGFRYMDFADD